MTHFPHSLLTCQPSQKRATVIKSSNGVVRGVPFVVVPDPLEAKLVIVTKPIPASIFRILVLEIFSGFDSLVSTLTVKLPIFFESLFLQQVGDLSDHEF